MIVLVTSCSDGQQVYLILVALNPFPPSPYQATHTDRMLTKLSACQSALEKMFQPPRQCRSQVLTEVLRRLCMASSSSVYSCCNYPQLSLSLVCREDVLIEYELLARSSQPSAVEYSGTRSPITRSDASLSFYSRSSMDRSLSSCHQSDDSHDQGCREPADVDPLAPSHLCCRLLMSKMQLY